MNTTRVVANTSTSDSASRAYTAPLITPSCARMSAIERSILRPHPAGVGSGQQLPASALDGHHHLCAGAEAVMVLRRHAGDAMRHRHVLLCLKAVAQGGAELRRARLGFGGSGRDGGGEQDAGGIGMGAEGRPAARAVPR